MKMWRRICNIFVVWMLTGFWHGAAWNFVVWGLFFAVLLILEKAFLLKYLEKGKVFNRLYVLFAVVIGFVLFNGETLAQAIKDIGGMFGAGNVPLVSAESIYYLKSYGLLFALGILGATPLPKLFVQKIKVARYLEPIVLVVFMGIVTAYLVDGSFNPFLYFRF